MSTIDENSIKDDLTYSLVQPYSPSSCILWIALFFVSFVICGPMYTGMVAIGVQTNLEDYFNIDDSQYNLLFTIGNLFSIFMPLIGGFLIDRIGYRWILFTGATGIFLGTVIEQLAIYTKSFELFAVGVTILSLLSNVLFISRYRMITKLFYKKHLALAIGFAAIFMKVAVFCGTVLTPYIYNETNSIADTYFMATLLCGISWISAIIGILIDLRIDLKTKIYVDSNFRDSTNTETVEYKIKWSDLKYMNKIVWTLSLMTGFSFGSFGAFFDNIDSFLERKYGLSNQAAGNILSTCTFSSFIICIIVSMYIDRTSKRSFVLVINEFLLILTFLLFNFVPTSDGGYLVLIPIGVLGMYLGCFTICTFICLPFVLDKKYMGLGFGFFSTISNIIEAAMPYIFGVILDDTKDGNIFVYSWDMYFLLGASIIATILSIMIFYFDRELGSPLNQIKLQENIKYDKANS